MLLLLLLPLLLLLLLPAREEGGDVGLTSRAGEHVRRGRRELAGAVLWAPCGVGGWEDGEGGDGGLTSTDEHVRHGLRKLAGGRGGGHLTCRAGCMRECAAWAAGRLAAAALCGGEDRRGGTPKGAVLCGCCARVEGRGGVLCGERARAVLCGCCAATTVLTGVHSLSVHELARCNAAVVLGGHGATGGECGCGQPLN